MKRILYILTSIALLMSFCADLSAQEDRREVRQGNRKFKEEAYDEATIEYLKAIGRDSSSVAANYNLANTLYRTGDNANAQKALERIKEVAPASGHGAEYFFNLGDVAIAQQDWKTAVEAFMQSLMLNPGDLKAKENYIYARKKLEDQQQNQQGQDQQNDDNQQNDQNDQQNDQNNQNDQNDQQNDNKDNENNQDNQNDDQQQDQQDQQQDKQNGRQPNITPQAAQQMLQAIQAKEKETQDKVNKAKAEAVRSRQKEKNW